MKQIITCLFLLVGFLSIDAQEVLSEGHIVLELTDAKAADPAAEQQVQMMIGTKVDVYFNDDNSLTTTNMMGGMLKTRALSNKVDGSTKMLMDMFGQKMYIPISKEEGESADEATGEMWESLDITYDESDTKEINGLVCHKISIAPKDGDEGFKMTGYVTDAITANARIMQFIDTKKFKGFPMEMTFNLFGSEMTVETQTLDKTVDVSVFELNTGGYKEMTMQELMDMMGQMGGGGFGF